MDDLDELVNYEIEDDDVAGGGGGIKGDSKK